jgi:hypothetical protein
LTFYVMPARPWATPAGCLAMDTHFKSLGAHEES